MIPPYPAVIVLELIPGQPGEPEVHHHVDITGEHQRHRQGILVGVEPAQPQVRQRIATADRTSRCLNRYQARQQPPQEDRPAYRWTDEDIENARKQEKDKLYPRIEDDGQLS